MKCKKLAALALSMALVVGMLAACGPSSSSSQAQGRKSATSQAAGGGTQADAAPTPVDTTVGVSSDPYDMEIAIDGVLYTLPAPVSQFTAGGWQVQDGDQLVDYTNGGVGSYETAMTKDGQRLEIVIANFHTEEAAPVKDCQVTGVRYSPSGTGIPVAVAGGITIGSGYDAVWNGHDNVVGYSNIVLWSCAELLYYSFTIDEATNTVTSIQIQSGVDEAGGGSSGGSSSGGNGNYSAPAALGIDWREGIIRIEGDLYQLPAPVSAFLNNGWEMVDAEYNPETLSPGSGFPSGTLVLEKNGKRIDTDVWNYDTVTQPVEDCSVYFVLLVDTSIDFELPGGLTWDTGIDTVRALYGDFTTETKDFYYYDTDKMSLAGTRIVLRYRDGAGPLAQVNFSREPD